MERKEKLYLVLCGLFLGALVICNIVTFKLTLLWQSSALAAIGLGFMVQTVGILPYPLTFLATDLISELYGKERANFAVTVGFIVSIFTLLVIFIGGAAPPLPKQVWNAEWHAKRIALKLPLEAAELKSIRKQADDWNSLALLRGQARIDAEAKFELEFTKTLSAENRGKYLALKESRAAWSASWLTGRAGLDDLFANIPDRHLGQDSMNGYFSEFFLNFPEKIPGDVAREALAAGQALKPVHENQSVWDYIFGSSVRAIFASMLAYLIAQLVDVKVYHFWRRLTHGRHLWLRNNGSTFFSQIVDTILVMFVLFYGTIETSTLWQWIWAGIAFKWIWALCDTPFMYLGVALARKHVPELFDPHTGRPYAGIEDEE